MNILVVSDLFPPLSLGGYEVAAAEVAGALRERGHEVGVLTTDWGITATPPRDDPPVSRVLHSRTAPRRFPWRLRLAAWARDDDHAVRTMLAQTRPDVLLLWNVGGIAHQVLVRLLNGKTPATVYVFGDWPLRKRIAPHSLDPWMSLFAPREEGTGRRALRHAAATTARVAGLSTTAEPLRFEHFAFGSRYMQKLFHERGLVARRSERVIHYGLFGAFARMAGEPRPMRSPGPLRLLFVGRLWESKGVHTIIEALRLLDCEPEPTLTIAGPAEDTAYVARLRQLSATLGVTDRVTWAGPTPREALPQMYASHDVVVFPSTYDEPFGIVQLEAMAAGCALVATGTGGSAEIFEPEANALRFSPGDAASLADQLRRLHDNPGLRVRLGASGKERVRSSFIGERMVDEIETHLIEVVRGVTG